MSGALRQLKKKGKVKPSPIDPALMAAWHNGFNQGVKQQLKSDMNTLAKLLEGLEEWPGIGEKTAGKIREHFLSKFGM
ncbi:helix-hairpin-helix domain-containing protein [Bacillus sp. UNC438CL73TsuS30]|uniref:helix-hairpin-helix domain-containing protein n=1 Tax=Bacillus sp. UNC438CL73TsuS30 TaxID=1340434 RepID=UPI00047C3B2A|nr:helix-hairpin-helix domain-containing protein [Bacillus sp. UNC438CL73TsuS30]